MKKSIFLFFAAILCAMTANAYNQSAKDLYFDNSEAKWNSCYVYIGHGTWTSVYPLTRVSGTQYLWKLAKADFNGGGSWNSATGWVLCYEKWWDSKGESIDKYTWHGDKNVTQKTTSAWVDTKIYKTNGTASTKSDNHTINAYKVTSYTKADYTITINTVEGGTLTVKDYDNNDVTTGASKIHLTVLKFSATPASGYVLDAVEINDGTNTTTIAAADLATTTHTLTSAVTITPVWRATTSTVTVTATATNGTVTGGGVVEEGTSVTLSATPDAGYQFVNWTVGGAEVSTANPYTFTAEEDVTVVANFEETPKVTVYFVNNSGWSKIQAYAWGDKGTNASWAGVDITANKLGEQIGGFDVYSYTVEQGLYANVIFNNGSAQTKDYVWTDGNYYWNNEAQGFIGGTKADAETKFSVPVEYEYVYLINTNDWAKAHIYTWTPEVAGWPGAAMTKEAEQIAGKDVYSYKVVKGTTFGGMLFNCGGDECKTGDQTWQAGKYYAPSKNEWYADAAAAEAALAAIEDVYSIKGVDALGLNWTETDTKDDMIKQGDGSYLLVKSNITLAAGNYEYKAIKNHNWEWKVINSGNNLTLHVDKSGRYNITFTLNAAATEVACALELLEEIEIIPDCYVSGNKNLTGKETEWQGNEFKMTYDDVKKLHYYTFDLKKDKTYELKAVCNDTWFGYDKLGAYYAEVTNKDGGIQVKLTADATVTVWFDYKTSKITFEGLTEKVYKDIIITVKANETAPKIHWWNAGDKLNDSEWDKLPEMTATANANEYSYTLKNVDAETGVEYLIKVGDLQSDNQKTKEDVSIDFRDICKVKVYGLNGWDKPYLLELADDYKTAKGTIVLEEKNYEFKMVEGNGDWLGNTGTIKKSESGWTFEKDKVNCKLQTKLAGNYIFTWDVTANKLSVTYPVKVTPAVEKGIFSVGEGKFVQFSTGNLQYNVGTNTWSFATNQYDYVGEPNINVGDPTFTGTIDMFGWSADGKYGVNPSNKNEDYNGGFADWGNLVNEADWYTLSADEWKYLLNTRANAANLKQIAKVGSVVGIMLFPDVWTMPADVNVTAAYDSYFKVNIYNYNFDQWTKLEEAGAVFLPAAGRRAGGYGNMINKEQETETRDEYLVNGGFYRWQDNTNIYCYYWTSTINESKDVSYLHNIQALGGDEYTIGTGAIWGEKGRYGQSVRLVKKATPDYTREVTSGDYGTICLPNGGLLFGASAFSVAKMEGTTILLDEVGTTMVGGTPYVVFPNTGATNLYVFYTDNVEAPAGEENGLYGSYTREPLAPNVGNYIMLPGNRYAEVTGDRVFVAANRAYFKLSEIQTKASAPAPGVRRIAIGQAPQVATGMENIDASAQPVKTIINGQLFILRGEKMYDAQGKLVK